MSEHAGKLEGKVAVVTGAGRGIGRAIVLAYAREGAAVCCAACTLEDIETTVEEIERLGGTGLAALTDVTDLDSVRRMFGLAAESLGGLDILVINAGGSFGHLRVEESAPDLWLATLGVNLTGAYYCAGTAILYLRERGAGKIITIGSGIGHQGRPIHLRLRLREGRAVDADPRAGPGAMAVQYKRQRAGSGPCHDRQGRRKLRATTPCLRSIAIG